MENPVNNIDEKNIDDEDTSSGSDTIIRPFNPNEIEIELSPEGSVIVDFGVFS